MIRGPLFLDAFDWSNSKVVNSKVVTGGTCVLFAHMSLPCRLPMQPPPPRFPAPDPYYLHHTPLNANAKCTDLRRPWPTCRFRAPATCRQRRGERQVTSPHVAEERDRLRAHMSLMRATGYEPTCRFRAPATCRDRLRVGWFNAFSFITVPREQKMLKGHLPRVIYHQVY